MRDCNDAWEHTVPTPCTLHPTPYAPPLPQRLCVLRVRARNLLSLTSSLPLSPLRAVQRL